MLRNYWLPPTTTFDQNVLLMFCFDFFQYLNFNELLFLFPRQQILKHIFIRKIEESNKALPVLMQMRP